MLSNDVTQGAVFPALLLTPKARLIAPLRVWRRSPDDFLLLTPLADTLGYVDDVCKVGAKAGTATEAQAQSEPATAVVASEQPATPVVGSDNRPEASWLEFVESRPAGIAST